LAGLFPGTFTDIACKTSPTVVPSTITSNLSDLDASSSIASGLNNATSVGDFGGVETLSDGCGHSGNLLVHHKSSGDAHEPVHDHDVDDTTGIKAKSSTDVPVPRSVSSVNTSDIFPSGFRETLIVHYLHTQITKEGFAYDFKANHPSSIGIHQEKRPCNIYFKMASVMARYGVEDWPKEKHSIEYFGDKLLTTSFVPSTSRQRREDGIDQRLRTLLSNFRT
jgi:hypothetical protein